MQSFSGMIGYICRCCDMITIISASVQAKRVRNKRVVSNPSIVDLNPLTLFPSMSDALLSSSWASCRTTETSTKTIHYGLPKVRFWCAQAIACPRSHILKQLPESTITASLALSCEMNAILLVELFGILNATVTSTLSCAPLDTTQAWLPSRN